MLTPLSTIDSATEEQASGHASGSGAQQSPHPVLGAIREQSRRRCCAQSPSRHCETQTPRGGVTYGRSVGEVGLDEARTLKWTAGSRGEKVTHGSGIGLA